MSPWLRTTHFSQHKVSNVVVQMCLYVWLMELHQCSSCVLFLRDLQKEVWVWGGLYKAVSICCCHIIHLLICLFAFAPREQFSGNA